MKNLNITQIDKIYGNLIEKYPPTKKCLIRIGTKRYCESTESWNDTNLLQDFDVVSKLDKYLEYRIPNLTV